MQGLVIHYTLILSSSFLHSSSLSHFCTTFFRGPKLPFCVWRWDKELGMNGFLVVIIISTTSLSMSSYLDTGDLELLVVVVCHSSRHTHLDGCCVVVIVRRIIGMPLSLLTFSTCCLRTHMCVRGCTDDCRYWWHVCCWSSHQLHVSTHICFAYHRPSLMKWCFASSIIWTYVRCQWLNDGLLISWLTRQEGHGYDLCWRLLERKVWTSNFDDNGWFGLLA